MQYMTNVVVATPSNMAERMGIFQFCAIQDKYKERLVTSWALQGYATCINAPQLLWFALLTDLARDQVLTTDLLYSTRFLTPIMWQVTESSSLMTQVLLINYLTSFRSFSGDLHQSTHLQFHMEVLKARRKLMVLSSHTSRVQKLVDFPFKKRNFPGASTYSWLQQQISHNTVD